MPIYTWSVYLHCSFPSPAPSGSQAKSRQVISCLKWYRPHTPSNCGIFTFRGCSCMHQSFWDPGKDSFSIIRSDKMFLQFSIKHHLIFGSKFDPLPYHPHITEVLQLRQHISLLSVKWVAFRDTRLHVIRHIIISWGQSGVALEGPKGERTINNITKKRKQIYIYIIYYIYNILYIYLHIYMKIFQQIRHCM